MKNIFYFFILTLILFSSCLTGEVMYYGSHTMLPDTDINMKNPGYWISKHPYPDKIIMNSKEINAFNQLTVDSNLNVRNINVINQTINIDVIKTNLYKTLDYFKKQKLFYLDKKTVDKTFYENLQANMNIENIDGNIHYGFITTTTSLRIFPTDTFLTEIPGELFFDSLQASIINIATPVNIIQTTSDKKWVYVFTTNVDGWVEYENIAFCNSAKFKKLTDENNFIVVTSAKTDIFLDDNITLYHTFARMGSRFNILDDNNSGYYKIYIPVRDQNANLVDGFGFIKKSDTSAGYLKYTPRIIIEQSFKQLNSPYGWGGMYGELDCSQLLYEVFLTTGITLPRNSSNQCKVGTTLSLPDNDDKNKINMIKNNAIQGISFLRLPGHIMLYLGYENDLIYVIHSVWGYREKISFSDTVRLINKVTVSTINLGEGTKKGSLLKRINRLNVIMGAPGN